jgi:hypothetical protein
MPETVVRVELRQATLTESARLREAGDRMFLALENPPPVRSLLRLRAGEELSAFEVARVIEVVDETEPARGCYGQRVSLDRLVEQDKVGSEHLEPGLRSGGGGIPSPVVIMNSGEMMMGEESGVFDLAGRAAEIRDSGGFDEPSSSEPESESESESESSSEEPSESDESDESDESERDSDESERE